MGVVLFPFTIHHSLFTIHGSASTGAAGPHPYTTNDTIRPGTHTTLRTVLPSRCRATL